MEKDRKMNINKAVTSLDRTKNGLPGRIEAIDDLITIYEDIIDKAVNLLEEPAQEFLSVQEAIETLCNQNKRTAVGLHAFIAKGGVAAAAAEVAYYQSQFGKMAGFYGADSVTNNRADSAT